MPNRLSTEKSLYLRQHANNPVDWYPWGLEAFKIAREKNKPVLVSIGYSSCHWCHVMARQCFDNEYIAEIMNKHFVNIKVDREERPDIDNLYMDVIQMLQQKGGWPLNVFCLPDGRPFFAGTYFPPEDIGHGIIPWPQLLMRISSHFQKKPAELAENADSITNNLLMLNNPFPEDTSRFSNTTIIGAAQVLCSAADKGNGGFQGAPKFPLSMCLDYLLSVRNTRSCETSHAPLDTDIDQVLTKSFDNIALGGLYDHIGGGFMRYCVDANWYIPHFEKMLYDNALLVTTFTLAWLQYRKPLYKQVVEETIDFLFREMAVTNGAFASAISAESEGVEGKYYAWSVKEIRALLPLDQAEAFCQAYQITDEGNFEDGLSFPRLTEATAHMRETLAAARQKLLAAREKRIAPGIDKKQLLYWNALTVKALAEAGYYFERQDCLAKAHELAEFLWSTFHTVKNGLLSICYDTEASINGYLHDYASLAETYLSLAGKVDILKPGLSQTYLARAKQLIETVTQHFKDTANPGYFFTADDQEQLFVRKKEWWDNAVPSGNSSMVHNLADLYAITQDESYLKAFKDLRGAYAELIVTSPSSVAHAINAIVAHEVGIAVLYLPPSADFSAVQKTLCQKHFRKVFVMTDLTLSSGFKLFVKGKEIDSFQSLEEALQKI